MAIPDNGSSNSRVNGMRGKKEEKGGGTQGRKESKGNARAYLRDALFYTIPKKSCASRKAQPIQFIIIHTVP